MTDFANKVSFEHVRAIKQTASALLCVIEGKERWVPRSCVDDDSEVYQESQEGTLVVSEWWATKAGLV